MFQIFIIFELLIIIAIYLIYQYYTTEKKVVKHTVNYFIDNTTPYLKPKQLKILSKSHTIKEYVRQTSIIVLENGKVNQLYLTLLVGQLLKEIWKTQRIDLLKKYLLFLESSLLPKSNVVDSLKSHSKLYMDDISKWKKGYNLIQSL
jgi:hypothetical protein